MRDDFELIDRRRSQRRRRGAQPNNLFDSAAGRRRRRRQCMITGHVLPGRQVQGAKR